MKLQSIYTFFAIFVINTEAGKLTPEENEARLKECGTVDWDTFGLGTSVHGSSTATFLSSRHVIMSADIVLKNDKTYYHNGQQFNDSKCKEGEHVHVKVDPKVYPFILLSWTLKERGIKIIDAHIICSRDTSILGGFFFFPMVVEITPRIEMKLPCLWDSNKEPVFRNDKEDLYVFTHSSYKEHKVKIIGTRIIDWLFFATTAFPHSDRRGAAIFKVRDLRWLLVGIGAGVYNKDTWFHNVMWFETDVCDLTGVCRALKAPEKTVTEEPSTEEPTTDKPTTKESTTEKPITVDVPTNEIPTEEPVTKEPITSAEPDNKATKTPEFTTTPAPPEPSEPEKSTPHDPEPMEPIKTIDLDEEYEEFKEREAKEDGDWDEWGNDFYRSADFFEKSGRRTELFVGFLMVIVVV